MSDPAALSLARPTALGRQEARADASLPADRPAQCIYLKIYGERNSGTNYLTRLCAGNYVAQQLRGDAGRVWTFGIRSARHMPEEERFRFRQRLHDDEMARIASSDFGWKHAAPPLETILAQPHSRETLFLILTKHPYSWVRSLFKRPYDYRPAMTDFGRFLREKFQISSSDCLPEGTNCNPVEMFRLKAAAYERLLRSGLQVVHIRYEDLIADPDKVLDMLSGKMMRSRDDYVDIEDDVKGSARTREDFLRQYSLASVGSALSAEDRTFINETLGKEVFGLLGYEML